MIGPRNSLDDTTHTRITSTCSVWYMDLGLNSISTLYQFPHHSHQVKKITEKISTPINYHPPPPFFMAHNYS